MSLNLLMKVSGRSSGRRENHQPTKKPSKATAMATKTMSGSGSIVRAQSAGERSLSSTVRSNDSAAPLMQCDRQLGDQRSSGDRTAILTGTFRVGQRIKISAIACPPTRNHQTWYADNVTIQRHLLLQQVIAAAEIFRAPCELDIRGIPVLLPEFMEVLNFDGV